MARVSAKLKFLKKAIFCKFNSECKRIRGSRHKRRVTRSRAAELQYSGRLEDCPGVLSLHLAAGTARAGN
jgi:hypothetical protein